MAELYLWFKWLHIVAVISWMAALLYLPRLYVYHAEAGAERVGHEQVGGLPRRRVHAVGHPDLAEGSLRPLDFTRGDKSRKPILSLFISYIFM